MFKAGEPRADGAGRKKGSKNKNSTAAIRDFLKRKLEEYTLNPDGKTVATYEADMAMLRPADRIAMIEKFAKFCLPTLSSVKLEDEEGNPMTIRVVYENAALIDQDETEDDMDYSVNLPGMED